MSPTSELGKIVKRNHRRQNLAVAVIAVLAAWAVYLGYESKGGLSSFQVSTCRIQNRGLKASAHLAPVMRDFNVFIQPIQGQKVLPRTIPSPPYRYTFRANGRQITVIKHERYNPLYFALINSRKELPRYNAEQSKQPHKRVCGSE